MVKCLHHYVAAFCHCKLIQMDTATGKEWYMSASILFYSLPIIVQKCTTVYDTVYLMHY